MIFWSRCLVERCCTTNENTADGKSVLQLSLQDGSDFDQVSGQFLRKIAASLVEVCVIESHEGGAVFKIGWYWRHPIASVRLISNVFRGARTFDLVDPGVYAECGLYRARNQSRGHWELSRHFGQYVHNTSPSFIWTSRRSYGQRGPSAQLRNG